MNADKKAQFVALRSGRQMFAKGGAVRRKKFDSGGGVFTAGGTPTALPPPPPPPTASNTSLTVPTVNTGTQGTGGLPLISTGFQAVGAPLQSGTTGGQLNNAYAQAQAGLGAQNQLLTGLQAQNGLANQSSVYGQQQTLANTLGGAGGIPAQVQALQGFQNIANGTGPNVANTMLTQATAQNVANQSALMAGQRGAASNVGLIARQAAQQGAGIQQQAALQGAQLEAQQQQAALGQAASIGQNLTAEQQAQQNALANTAGTQVNQLGQAVSGVNTATQNEQNLLEGANTALNNATVGQQSNLNNVNAQISQGNQAAGNSLLSGIMNSGSALLSSIPSLAQGGEVNFEDAAYTAPQSASAPNIGSMSATNESAPFAQGSKGSGGGSGGSGGGIAALAALFAKGGNVCKGPHQSHVANFLLAKGEDVPALASPGERYLEPEDVKKVMMGANPLKLGRVIPGKAKVKGDSLTNDVVKESFRVGGVVLPRHITNTMSREKAELFVHRAEAKKRLSTHN